MRKRFTVACVDGVTSEHRARTFSGAEDTTKTQRVVTKTRKKITVSPYVFLSSAVKNGLRMLQKQAHIQRLFTQVQVI